MLSYFKIVLNSKLFLHFDKTPQKYKDNVKLVQCKLNLFKIKPHQSGKS